MPARKKANKKEWLVGTSGYSYKEWKGGFYPEKIKDGDMLSFYSSRFNSVEINNTFYRMPAQSLLEKLYRETGKNFRFSIKAPRSITHHSKLSGTGESLAFLFKQLAFLKEKLSIVLFQLPPSLRLNASLLAQFLKELPAGACTAFEFRHTTWFCAEIFEMLEKHGSTLVFSDESNDLESFPFARFASSYCRLRQLEYDDAALETIVSRLKPCARCFVYFKHEEEATGPALADRFVKISALQA